MKCETTENGRSFALRSVSTHKTSDPFGQFKSAGDPTTGRDYQLA